jgi:hypothetical membrane protein
MAMKRALLRCGVIGPVFFTIAYLIEGATRADYDPLSNAVSELALGDQGWTQIANFLITGILFVAFAFALGLRRHREGWALPAAVALIGVGLMQRLSLTAGWAWTATLAYDTLRRSSLDEPAERG